MKIIDTRSRRAEVEFSKLAVKDVFESEGDFCIRCGTIRPFGIEFNALNLRTGWHGRFSDDQLVIPLKAHVVIEEYDNADNN